MKTTATNNIPAWCKPFTEVYRKANGGRWHLYDIICQTADGVKVRMFEDYSERIVTKTLACIISDGEKIASGEYETEARNLTHRQTEAVGHAFDVLPAGTIICLDGFHKEYQRITGYDQVHHRYYTNTWPQGIRAELVGTYYDICKPDNKHTAEDLPTWCKSGAKIFWTDEYAIQDISDGIVWMERPFTKLATGISADLFILKVDCKHITLQQAD